MRIIAITFIFLGILIGIIICLPFIIFCLIRDIFRKAYYYNVPLDEAQFSESNESLEKELLWGATHIKGFLRKARKKPLFAGYYYTRECTAGFPWFVFFCEKCEKYRAGRIKGHSSNYVECLECINEFDLTNCNKIKTFWWLPYNIEYNHPILSPNLNPER